jgi:L-glyceraldehyde 3-phosphate reductase
MSLSWLLADARITSVLIGASSPEQVVENAKCVEKTAFPPDELAQIDRICQGA